MKRALIGILVVGVVLAGAWLPSVIAQQQGPGAAVTQTGTRGDAALRCDSATALTGINPLTLQNPGAGLSNYVTYIGNWGDVSGTVIVATPTALSTTGFTGTSAAFMPVNMASTGSFVTGAVGGSAIVFNPPIKGQANTAQTLVPTNAGIVGVVSVAESCYYPAP